MTNPRIHCFYSPFSYNPSLPSFLTRPLGRLVRLTLQRCTISHQPRPACVTQRHRQRAGEYPVRAQQKQPDYRPPWRRFELSVNGVKKTFVGRSAKECKAVSQLFIQPGCRYFSGGAAKPGWVVPKQHYFGPAIPDNAYYGEHATYSHFVLFTRGFRPYVEKLLEDCWRTLKEAALSIWRPLASFTLRRNPEIRLQLAALMSFLATHAVITGYFNGTYQRLVDISSLLELRKAQRYAAEGFWLSPSEQQEQRLQQYAKHHRDLEQTWKQAMQEATLLRSFEALVRFLKTAEGELREVGHLSNETAAHERRNAQHCSSRVFGIPPFLLWSFSAVPYGKEDPYTQTFRIPDHEQPLRAFALSFTSNNISGNWGDYVNRQDNKNALMRPARMMFTDALIPTTK